ncbi:MAG: mechanosensitive ion channel protein [Leptolyngbya sp.]|nr:MAG: mechanosensitive ion channel protein [Leptolyngbya sp.]
MLNRFTFRLTQLLIVGVVCLMGFHLIGINPARSQSPPSAEVQQAIGAEPGSIVLDGKTLVQIRSNFGPLSALQRADLANDRLTKVANNSQISPASIRAESVQDITLIVAGKENIHIATITPEDAKAEGLTQAALTKDYLAAIRSSLITYREQRSVENILRGIGYAILATLLLWIVVQLLNKLFAITIDRLNNWLGQYSDRLNNSNKGIVAITPFVTVALHIAELGRNVLYLSLACLYLFLIFGFFPWTQGLSSNFWTIISSTLADFERAIVGYLPSLFTLVLILFITREILSFIHLFFQEIKLGNISLPWFYADWVQPTFQLVRFFIFALALAIAMPSLPGFKSPAFQGVSLVVSALLTLGAASAVSNIIGGFIVVYTRSFQIGDMIKIGELIGIVLEKDVLVTRIRTPKNVVITIPNSTILGSNIINYSTLAKDLGDTTGLILHTTITLGYDIPWQKVHEVLIQAAQATPKILSNPAPFVLQTSLNDYHVSYELNAYTDSPECSPAIYSDLHRNIQNKCNEVNIEIMSPSFLAMRDGNHSTIPENYLPDDYQTPNFYIDSSKNQSPK